MKLDQDAVAVVTGAASGIGYALAAALVDRGLAVVLADVEQAALDAAVAELGGRGRVTGVRTDVRSADEVQRLADAAVAEFGRVDVVCNVAGVAGPWRPSWEQSPDDWRWILDVNLFGVIHGIRAFVPYLVARGRGHVVNMASVAGVAPVPGGGNGPYTASKHAVVGLSELLRAELDGIAPDVGVTIVCPGRVATRLRESDRNRPPEFGGRPGEQPLRPATETEPSEASPAELAEQIIAAVESDRLFLIPGVAATRMARARAERLLRELDAGEVLTP